jgi:hypothetical protein
VRSIITSTSQLSELRASVRRDITAAGDDHRVIDDFVSAVNEVAAVSLSQSGPARSSIDVRWARRTQPYAELYAEIRNTGGAPTTTFTEGLVSHILEHTAERVDVHARIGGSVVIVRSRIKPHDS